MFFRNELNLALKKISELETEINNLKKDTVSRKEFSELQNKLSKAEETIKKLSEDKTDAINKAKPDKTEVDVQPDKSKIAVSDKELSIEINETETKTKKTVSVKDFAAKNKKADCSIFKYADYKDGIEIIQYIGLNRTKVDIPEYIDNKPVIRIGNNAFEGTNEITDVSFPETLKEIGNSAFRGCELKKFSGANQLESIGKYAFVGSGLQEINIPDNVTVIEEETFSGCSELSVVKFPAKLEKICELAFGFCKKLQSIELPHTLKRIEKSAFYQAGLYKIIIPENVSFVGKGALENNQYSYYHIAFLSTETEICDLPLCTTAYCIPGGKTYDCLRKQKKTIKPLKEFPE